MGNRDELTLSDFNAWLRGLDVHDLIEAETSVAEARERKRNEGRVSLIRVEADGINVAWFPEGQMKEVLEYLLANVSELSSLDGMVRTDLIKVPESEVEDRLADRWW